MGIKVDAGETPQEALRREVHEEMQCKVEIGDQVEHTIYEYDFGIVHLTTYYCKLVEGSTVLTEDVFTCQIQKGHTTSLSMYKGV